MITEYIGGNLSQSKPDFGGQCCRSTIQAVDGKVQKEITSRNIEARR